MHVAEAEDYCPRTSELVATIWKQAILSRPHLLIFILFVFADDYCSFIPSLLIANENRVAAVSVMSAFLPSPLLQIVTVSFCKMALPSYFVCILC
jgi:hypothetical protein